VLNLIREFLEFYELDFTLSVFTPESRCNIEYKELSRTDLLKELSLNSVSDSQLPVLSHLLDLKRNVNQIITMEETIPSPGALNSTYTVGNSMENTPDRRETLPEVPEEPSENNRYDTELYTYVYYYY